MFQNVPIFDQLTKCLKRICRAHERDATLKNWNIGTVLGLVMKWRRVLVSLCLLLMFLACFGFLVDVPVATCQRVSVSRVVPVSVVEGGVTWNYTVTLNTTMGIIVIGLYDDMPITSGNFENLTAHGIYDGTQFTRVAYGFVIQGGDTSSKGIVVPPIKDELPNKHSNIVGSVAMAKTSQPNSATSQFFINLANNTFLDSDYSVFGQVIQGMDVVNSIGNVPIVPVNSETDGTPVTPITILKATLSLPQVPEYTLIAVLPLFMIVALFAVALQRRYRARAQTKTLTQSEFKRYENTRNHFRHNLQETKRMGTGPDRSAWCPNLIMRCLFVSFSKSLS